MRFHVYDMVGQISEIGQIEGDTLSDACIRQWPEGYVIEIFQNLNQADVAEIRGIIFGDLKFQVQAELQELPSAS